MSRILLLGNSDIVLYNFRLELIKRLIKDGHEVFISSPFGERINELVKLGCKYEQIEIARHGKNPIEDLILLKNYKNLLKKVQPDTVFTYTIKPNIYGGMACSRLGVPYIANITGLGTAVENKGIMQIITVSLYKLAFRKVKCIFFQNTENQQFFFERKIGIGKHKLIPGSGVNLERFYLREYPQEENGIIKFAFISRIMKEKGIDLYLDTAKAIKQKYPNTEFHICGFCEPEYQGKLNEYDKDGTVIYHGMIRNVGEFLRDIHCVVHPSYYPEGISNVLLESCASGRPIITTDRSGCREVVDDGVNGYMIPCKNGKELYEAVDKFMRLSNDARKTMGLKGRKKVVKEFDRQIIVQKYIDEVNYF